MSAQPQDTPTSGSGSAPAPMDVGEDERIIKFTYHY